MKKQIDLNWLKGKSEAEQRALLDDSGIPWGWMRGYPRVSAAEAEALRSGKPYRPSDFDMERLSFCIGYWDGYGFDGDPDTDPLVIKCLAKGYIMENPKYAAEKAEKEARIAQLKAQYGDGHYSVGVGFTHHRWIATESGKAFIRQLVW